jgi:ABC-type multidrug transport system fused ATPase/permease subunit
MGLLDLLGVLAIGLLGALSVSGIQSTSPGDRVSGVLSFLRISEASFQLQVTFIGATATLLLVGRTILSMIITRRVLFFLSNRGAKISSNLIARLLAQPLLFVQTRTSQETLFALTSGVSIITLQILATCIVLVADVSLLLVMAVGLFVVDPGTALGTFAVFGIIGYILYRFMHLRANALGLESSQLNILSNQKITEVFSSYRESVVRNRRDYYSREIGKIRFLLANNSAEMNFMPYVSKYVIETAVILGAVLLAAAQFVLQDATQAVATLAIFLAAGTRIAPAVLRVQQGMVTISGAIGQSTPTLNLIDQLGSTPVIENIDDSVDVTHEGFVAEVIVNGVSLAYPNGSGYAIEKMNLNIPVGSSVALVGPSGAGKTTLVDVILGVLSADEGTVSISGLSPLSAISKWPGAIAYVPQDVMISSGTIRQNVSLGYPIEAAKEDLVTSALKVAQLNEFVSNLPNGIDTHVGEQGSKISGGQRQRLGIARAMFTRPLLLVLDEATSSLDGETEAAISEAIHELRGSTTVVMIAHRLSTVRNADLVVYMTDGEILATGTFDEVREAIPDFDRQAKLMGL